MRLHHYHATTTWTGNRGEGTADYKVYERAHLISVKGKPDIEGSSDVAFRGDKSKYTPEDMLVCSLSTCHMLWYLHLCAVNGVVVTAYVDKAVGIMQEDDKGSGYFTEVTLHPRVSVSEKNMIEKANALHHEANKMCFVANSVKFPVYHKPVAVEATLVEKD
jgi:organic hydroperoxide reductase OsmC/OhrA